MAQPAPFIVFSLPRSRSAWIQHWLHTVSGRPVGHDLAVHCDSTDEFFNGLVQLAGTCETGAVEAWPLIRRALPNAKILVIQRPVHEVLHSLTNNGFMYCLGDIQRKAQALDDCAKASGVMSVPFAHLHYPEVCAMIQEHCLGQPFNWPVWKDLAHMNVQLNLSARRELLGTRRYAIEQLRKEMYARLENPTDWIWMGEEFWPTVAEECEELGQQHHTEAKLDIEGIFKLNHNLLSQMAQSGLLRIWTVRVNSKLVGYCMWMKEVNFEADAPPTIVHGPFYISPEYSKLRLGARLLKTCLTQFANEGYTLARLHHTMQGRGAKAGVLYTRLGAKEYQREYVLPLKRTNPNA